MWFINNIVSALNSISSFFYSIYLEVYSWVYPLWLVADLFYSLSSLFANIAWNFSYFSSWVIDVSLRITYFITEAQIWATFGYYFNAAADAWSWIGNFAWNFTVYANNWWLSTSFTVQSWINDAIQGFQAQVNNITSWLGSLQGAWDDFKLRIPTIDSVLIWFSDWWSHILAQLITWGALTALQIQSLIDSAFTIRDSYWAGWQELRGTVTEFISNPLSWLEERFTDWFLGKE